MTSLMQFSEHQQRTNEGVQNNHYQTHNKEEK